MSRLSYLSFFVLFFLSCSSLKSKFKSVETKIYTGYLVYYIALDNPNSCDFRIAYTVFCKSWGNVEKLIYDEKFYLDPIEYSKLSFMINELGHVMIPNDDPRLCTDLAFSLSHQIDKESIVHRDRLPLSEIGSITNSFFLIDKVTFQALPANKVIDCGILSNSRLYDLSKILIYQLSSINSISPNLLMYNVNQIQKCKICIRSY
jgi:hypothetical protein